MNLYCRVMLEVNYSVGDIKNYDLGEGIVCLREGNGGKGGGKWGKRGREWGKRGGKTGVREVGNAYPPVHPLRRRAENFNNFRLLFFSKRNHKISFITEQEQISHRPCAIRAYRTTHKICLNSLVSNPI